MLINSRVNGSNSQVVQNCDWLGVDMYPYFQTVDSNGIDNGAELFFEAYRNTTSASQGKPVWITETGWPVSGAPSNQAIASVDNAKRYWNDVACKVLGVTNTWWYTLQDAEPDTPSPSFGLVSGPQLSTTPIFDLSCSNSSKPSNSTTGGSGSPTGGSSSPSGGSSTGGSSPSGGSTGGSSSPSGGSSSNGGSSAPSGGSSSNGGSSAPSGGSSTGGSSSPSGGSSSNGGSSSPTGSNGAPGSYGGSSSPGSSGSPGSSSPYGSAPYSSGSKTNGTGSASPTGGYKGSSTGGAQYTGAAVANKASAAVVAGAFGLAALFA